MESDYEMVCSSYVMKCVSVVLDMIGLSYFRHNKLSSLFQKHVDTHLVNVLLGYSCLKPSMMICLHFMATYYEVVASYNEYERLVK